MHKEILMKNVIFFLFGFLLIFGCINLGEPEKQIEEEEELIVIVPSFSITYPSNNLKIEVNSQTNNVDLLLKTSDITLRPAGTKNVNGEGHFILLFDNLPLKEVFSESYVMENVSLGEHTLLIEFVNNDGSSYSPKLIKTINFELYSKEPIKYEPITYIINLEDNQFVPKEITIKQTDSVSFNNLENIAHGIKIGNNTIIPPIVSGMSATYQFNEKGEYEIISLLIPTIKGKVIVE